MKGFRRIVLVIGLATFANGAAIAKKPESPGNSPGHKPAHAQGADPKHKPSGGGERYFTDSRLHTIRSYYADAGRSGACPPGLAKKNNRCLPPGQAKRWRVGAPLPPDLVYYDVPNALLHELGRTPEGQRIVRVGTDLLLISVGSGMVLDAIEDLDDIF